MPSKKEKSEKTGIEGTTLVLEYLKQQNRPYSAIDISANLHGKVTKTQAPKILKELVDSNQIASKAAGKQIIYHALQTPADSLSTRELAQIDESIKALRDEVMRLKEEERLLKSNLADYRATINPPELKIQLDALAEEKIQLQEQYIQAQSRVVEVVSNTEKTEIEASWKWWSYKSKARKQACMELWGTLIDGMPQTKSKDELWEEIGLELPSTN